MQDKYSTIQLRYELYLPCQEVLVCCSVDSFEKTEERDDYHHTVGCTCTPMLTTTNSHKFIMCCTMMYRDRFEKVRYFIFSFADAASLRSRLMMGTNSYSTARVPPEFVCLGQECVWKHQCLAAWGIWWSMCERRRLPFIRYFSSHTLSGGVDGGGGSQASHIPVVRKKCEPLLEDWMDE